MGTYVWCEDSKSGYDFWHNVFGVLFPEYIVQSKKNNTELRKAVGNIKDADNEYYILVDHAIDNPDVLREVSAIRRAASGKANIKMISIHSFEFVLLSFELLEKWVFAEEDELKKKREKFLKLRKLFTEAVVTGGSSEILEQLRNDTNLLGKNTEQIAEYLLTSITRNTGFVTTKKALGECFVCDCCEWKKRKEDDICGLDEERISGAEKMRLIVSYSVLKSAFEKVGLL